MSKNFFSLGMLFFIICPQTIFASEQTTIRPIMQKLLLIKLDDLRSSSPSEEDSTLPKGERKVLSPFEDGEKFWKYAREHVEKVVQTNPQAIFCLDYDTVLLHLMSQSLQSEPEDQQKLLATFKSQAQKMSQIAPKRIRGMKIVHRAISDLKFVAALIEPHLEDLASLEISPLSPAKTEESCPTQISTPR